jgi:hypothetical protein
MVIHSSSHRLSRYLDSPKQAEFLYNCVQQPLESNRMKRYGNKSNKSGVVAYEIRSTSIDVKFVDKEETYTYSYKRAGKEHVEEMKKLAKKGEGLATYIAQNVHDLYDR